MVRVSGHWHCCQSRQENTNTMRHGCHKRGMGCCKFHFTTEWHCHTLKGPHALQLYFNSFPSPVILEPVLVWLYTVIPDLRGGISGVSFTTLLLELWWSVQWSSALPLLRKLSKPLHTSALLIYLWHQSWCLVCPPVYLSTMGLSTISWFATLSVHGTCPDWCHKLRLLHGSPSSCPSPLLAVTGILSKGNQRVWENIALT